MPFEEVSLPEPRPARGGARAAGGGLGAEDVRDDREARVGARGRALAIPDLVRIRSGDASSAPDAVVLPGSADAGGGRARPRARSSGWRWCPFGGGTSVVGGVEPVRGRLRGASISLDLRPARRRRWRWTGPRSPPRSTPACSGRRPSGGSAPRA